MTSAHPAPPALLASLAALCLRPVSFFLPALAALATLSLACLPAHAAASSSAADVRYRQDLAACAQRATPDERQDCQHEAAAARDQARHESAADAAEDAAADTPAARERNARARCANLPPAYQHDCLSRVQGQGEVSGSVLGGGILRETVTVVPAAPAGSAPR